MMVISLRMNSRVQDYDGSESERVRVRVCCPYWRMRIGVLAAYDGVLLVLVPGTSTTWVPVVFVNLELMDRNSSSARR